MESYFTVGKVIGYHTESEKKGLLKVNLSAHEDDEQLIENVRMLLPYRNGEKGLYLLPEIGDLVLVTTLGGAYGMAFCLGSFAPVGDAFSGALFEEKNNKKVYRARGGVEISLSDEEKKQQISITTPKKLTVTMSDEDSKICVTGENGKTSLTLNMEKGEVEISAEKKLTISCGGATIAIDDSGKISVTAKDALEASGQAIKLSAKMKLEASGQDVAISSKTNAKLSANGNFDVSANGIAQIKGSMLKLN